MTTPQLGEHDMRQLLAEVDTLTPPATDSPTYLAGFKHGVLDAAEKIRAAWQRIAATAYADTLDATEVDAPGGDLDALAEVASALLGLAVKLDMADQSDIDRRMSALGGRA